MAKKVNSKVESKSLQAANETALTAFPVTEICKAFGLMADGTAVSESGREEKESAAQNVCVLAVKFAATNNTATAETIAKGWRDNMKLVAQRLAAEGNRFAETVTPKDKEKAPTHRLTGYGRNVSSIAKGCIDFEINAESAESYRDLRKEVEAKRAEERALHDPEAAALAEAKDACSEVFKALLKAADRKSDVENIQGALQEALDKINARSQESKETPESEEERKAA